MWTLAEQEEWRLDQYCFLLFSELPLSLCNLETFQLKRGTHFKGSKGQIKFTLSILQDIQSTAVNFLDYPAHATRYELISSLCSLMFQIDPMLGQKDESIQEGSC
jgi:hypothetical protein